MGLLITAMLLAGAAQPFTAPERLAAARAAGFKVNGGRIVNECDVTAEQINFEREDLNGDGAPEIIVSDGGACYGNGGSMFVVLTRNRQGALAPVLSAQGMAVVRPTKHLGWKDIEIGGPGMGRMPVARWNGSKYVY